MRTFHLWDLEDQVPPQVLIIFMATEFRTLQAAQLWLCLALRDLGLPLEAQQAFAVPHDPMLIPFINIEIVDYEIEVDGDVIGRDTPEAWAAWLASDHVQCLRLLYLHYERNDTGSLILLQDAIDRASL